MKTWSFSQLSVFLSQYSKTWSVFTESQLSIYLVSLLQHLTFSAGQTCVSCLLRVNSACQDIANLHEMKWLEKTRADQSSRTLGCQEVSDISQSEESMETQWPMRGQYGDTMTNERAVWRRDDQWEGRKCGQWREVRGEEAGKCRCLCGESIMFTDEEIWDIIWTYLEFITMLLYWAPIRARLKPDILEFKNTPLRVQHLGSWQSCPHYRALMLGNDCYFLIHWFTRPYEYSEFSRALTNMHSRSFFTCTFMALFLDIEITA